MATPPTDAVIRFEPDAYDLNRPWLLGRQSAGHGFLRAAVEGRGDGPVYGYTAHEASAKMFGRMVRGFDPTAEPVWIQGEQLDHIGQMRGVLYLGDPALGRYARIRLRTGPARYSLCGVTHTLASDGAQQSIADLLSEAVMPWDALICTSTAAFKAVQTVLEAQAEYQRWRFGPDIRLRPPQLPTIPLGVHCAEFDFSEDEIAAAREALGVSSEEIAALYVGRLVLTGKAHPAPMFLGLQAAAERSGKTLVLILCGRTPNEHVEALYLAGAATYAPDVRIIRVDSREDAARRQAWAAGDLFISLADGIQETYGLTPVEAMAAGLPVVVSDYDGYRDTVREGIDGFRIASFAPEPGAAGRTHAFRQELNLLSYNEYCLHVAAATSVDLGQLIDRLTILAQQPELRRRLGAEGKARVRELYDWRQVFREYQALWTDLNARRAAAANDPADLAWTRAAPKVSPARLDPFQSFAHYPTILIGPDTRVALAPGVTLETYRARAADALFSGAVVPEAVVLPIWAVLEPGPHDLATLARAANLSVGWATTMIGALAKMGLVSLR